MPRIDPVQLLNCLSVLLSPNGGIKSRNEVRRLVNLMLKFSKKLVSKCIYIQILKNTETELLGLFMGSDGWLLVHMWLTESIVAKNWPLVKELLELLLLCPVDIERLKTNNCPKLVKELSKDGNHFELVEMRLCLWDKSVEEFKNKILKQNSWNEIFQFLEENYDNLTSKEKKEVAIRALASKLVEQWLKTVKGEHVIPIKEVDIANIIATAHEDEKQTEIKPDEIDIDAKEIQLEPVKVEPVVADVGNDFSTQEIATDTVKPQEIKEELIKEENDEQETLPVLKITVKDGKQVISQVDDVELEEKLPDVEKSTVKVKSKEKSKDKNSSSKSSSKHSSKSSSSDKHKSSHKSSSSSSSSSSSRSKDKQRDKDKHSSHSSKSKNESRKSTEKSSKSKDDRSHRTEKEKDKDGSQVKPKEADKYKTKDERSKDVSKNITEKPDTKIPVPSIHKLGKIPKLTDVKKEKPSISIEVRKPDDPKPKTVKTFHSKFRKHGLEEEVKPPPSRATVLSKKPTPPVLPPIVAIPKRPSPVHNEPPPEKKAKTVEIVEKPGSIKLIPPKPKPMLLLESDMFMDALNASATNKKEPKKRKRRTSGSKDGNTPNENSPPHTPTAISSPSSEGKSIPPRFYQDTLEAEESKEKCASPDAKENTDIKIEKNEVEPMEIVEPPHTVTVNGLKGVLCYHKRKGPKKSIKWKPDTELEEVQYFELDETERVNVTKTFTDMKYLERIHEREAFEKARNLSTDDVMEERTSWRPLIPIDLDSQTEVDYGKNSKEKEIQAIRQKGTLQPLYFHKAMIPDSPNEPDLETHTYSEPTIIPLEDITGNQDSNISDFRNMPWPEPKGNAPPVSSNLSMPAMFPSNIPQFPNGFPAAQFPGVPGFQGPNIVPGDWPNGVPPHIIANGIPGPMNPAQLNPGSLPPGSVPPGMMMPPEAMMMGPDIFNGPNPMFPTPPEGFNMPQNMFPMDFNLPGPQVPQGPSGPEGFPGPGNFRGAMRGGRGAGGHWRGKAGGNWEGGPQRGRGGHGRGGRKAVCIYFQRKGSCRQGDNCSFLHPGVNCPF